MIPTAYAVYSFVAGIAATVFSILYLAMRFEDEIHNARYRLGVRDGRDRERALEKTTRRAGARSSLQKVFSC